MDTIMKLAVLFNLRDGFSGPAQGIMRRFQAVREEAERQGPMLQFGTNMTMAGQRMTEMGAAGLGAAQSMVQPFIELEDAAAMLSTVWATLPDVDAVVDNAVQRARDWSKIHGQSAKEFLDTTYMLAGAGLNQEQAIEGAGIALKVAAATMGTGGDAANLLGVLLNNMGDKAADANTEMKRLGDMVTATQNTFSIANLKQLQDGLANATPAALAAGLSLEQLLGVVGQLNNAGVQGANAGTAFAAMLSQMESASKKLGFGIERNAQGGIDALRTLIRMKGFADKNGKLSADDTERFKSAFGDEGLRAIQLLLPKLSELSVGVANVGQAAAGSTDRAVARIEKTLGHRLKVAANNAKDAAISLAESMVPALEKVSDSFSKMVEWLSKFVAEHPKLAAMAGTVFVLGSAFLIVAGPLISLIGGVITLIAVLKVARVAMLAQAGAAAGSTAVSSGIFSRFWGFLKMGFAGAGRAIGMAGTAIGALGARLGALVGWLATNPVGLTLLLIAGAVGLIITHWDAIQDACVEAIDVISSEMRRLGRFMKRIWNESLDAISNFFTKMGELPGRGTALLWRGLNEWTDWVDEAGASLKSASVRFWNNFTDAAHEAWVKVKGMVRDGMNWMVEQLDLFGILSQENDPVAAEMRRQQVQFGADVGAAMGATTLEDLKGGDAPVLKLEAPWDREKTESTSGAADGSALPGQYRAIDSKEKKGDTIHIGSVNLNGVADPDQFLRVLKQRTAEASAV
ncbi:MAG: phage tail tape measure protein [Myxococcales bacterium]|uniref:phage tail tape measure protein n=1 Tax=Sediminibacterium sp. TaxID=1917865 RepID=UPI001D67CA52|nr:phage tail tape measure protein [Sediminibacterium sp.]MBT9485841.1 phage tail tape measure protein [Sediminibacterium sp.]MBT9556869.1 phage tail tape measure protein [Myxococcales bacterium]